MTTTPTTELVSMISSSVAPSTSSPIKVYMHVVGSASADVRAMRAGTALVKAGFNVSVLDVASEDTQLAEENREGMHIQHLLVPESFVATRFKRRTLFRAIVLCIRTTFRLINTQADIYHALDLPALPASYIAATVRHKPLVFESYELPLSTLPLAEMSVSRRLLQALVAFLLRHMMSRCAAVIVVSPSIEREMCKRYSCSTVSLVRNIAPYRKVPRSGKLREQLKLAPHMRIALYQGYLQPDRGLDLLVKAAPFLEKNVILVLMGEDRLGTQGKLEALIISEGVADRVKIIPAVPYTELLEWTTSADIGLIVYPQDYSPNVQMMLPNKLFEFLMAGVPVLASPLDDVVDIIRSYNVGHVVSSLAPTDIGTAINAMLADQHALDRMRSNALKAVQEDLNWEKEQQQLVHLYYGIPASKEQMPSKVNLNSSADAIAQVLSRSPRATRKMPRTGSDGAITTSVPYTVAANDRLKRSCIDGAWKTPPER